MSTRWVDSVAFALGGKSNQLGGGSRRTSNFYCGKLRNTSQGLETLTGALAEVFRGVD